MAAAVLAIASTDAVVSEAQMQRAVPGTTFPATVRLYVCTLPSNVVVQLGATRTAFVHTVLIRATSETEAMLLAHQVDFVGDDWRVCSVTGSVGCRHYFMRDGIQCDPAE